MYGPLAGRTFHAGQVIPVTGLYRASHSALHGVGLSLVLFVNARFPGCVVCDKQVDYEIIRALPQILDDDDFRHDA